MRVLIAPDKFKGTLSAGEAAGAIARGVVRAADDRGIRIDVDRCPVADGGEGTASVVEHALQERAIAADVPATDLLGERATARVVRWRDGSGGRTILIESAQVIGLERVEASGHDPGAYDSSALGSLIASLEPRACDTLIIGLGGSATVDGGVGMARALGWRFVDAHDREVLRTDEYERIERVIAPSERTAFRVIVLCDVDSPLLGERGAARVFGPQKGASADQVEQLEQGLAHLAELCRASGIAGAPSAGGAGAAGGLGFGLAAFLGAELVRGAEYLLDLIGFDDRLMRAEVLVTGEGRLDAQTSAGKAPMEAARRARSAGKPVLAVVGAADPGADRAGDGFDGVWSCEGEHGDAGVRLERASARAMAHRLDPRA